jgi:hypothetical protein
MLLKGAQQIGGIGASEGGENGNAWRILREQRKNLPGKFSVLGRMVSGLNA